MATTALYTEINHVINTFGAPFFQLLAVRAVLASLVSFFLSFFRLYHLSFKA